MGKNIALLYMSAYFAQPAPEGSKNRFLRTQTNEAAVSALWKDPASRPDKIVALCSDTVRTKPTVPAADGSGNKVPTLEYFRDEFLEARPFTVNLCLTKDKTEANGNALFRVATLTEAQEYLTAAVEQGELLLDLTRKDTVAQGIVYYQSVQQYRNQINHATDSAVKFQKDTGLLPLSTSAIEQTLGDVAFYLFKLKECKTTAPAGIELLDSNKAF